MWLEAQAIIAKSFENEADVFLVLLEGAFGVDDDIVKVSVAEDTKVGVEDGIDKSLEDRRGGGKTHRHDGVFIGAKEGFESGGFLRARGHPEVRETGADVHRGDPIGASEIIHERARERDGVLIEHDLAIQVAVINDEAELSGTTACGGVAYEEDGRGVLGF